MCYGRPAALNRECCQGPRTRCGRVIELSFPNKDKSLACPWKQQARGGPPGLVGIKFEDLNWKSDIFVLPLYINPWAVPNLWASQQTGAYFRMSRPFRQGLWDTLVSASRICHASQDRTCGFWFELSCSYVTGLHNSPPALSPCLPAFPIFPLISDRSAFPCHTPI